MPKWCVHISILSTYEHVVDANSEQEAITLATGRYQDGDTGQRIDFEVDNIDAFPLEEEED